MPVQFVAGDLFENVHHAQAFAHGCNCQGSMGAGIATGIRARYPEMFERYRAMCKAEPRQFNLGDAWLWKSDDQPWVFNLGTQEGIWRARASYEAIETSLRSMRVQAEAENIRSIAAPRIGVGYGGLSWKKVKAIIEVVFGDWPGDLIVYETFVPASGSETEAASNAKPAPRKKRATAKGKKQQVRFRAITIACTDLAKSVAFYENVLGATPLPTDHGTCRWYRLGEIDMTLMPNAEQKSTATFPNHAMAMLWLEVDDLEAAKRRFADHEVEIVDEGDDQFVTIADPDGIVIEVWETTGDE
jgi:O-acetyl-ADP-ribose deacetylase (regulator of RNase III)/catechol 2,3-dioxygenase-like lactoylglutathione lyase family enzyme